MSVSSSESSTALLATEIVRAFLATNTITAEDLPKLVRALREALSETAPSSSSEADVAPASEVTETSHAGGEWPADQRKPAVPPEQSVFPDFLISLEDGARYRSLRRHLRVKYGMTPDDYRRRWGLPPDYPMVAPNYAKERSEVAKRIGLGRKSGGAATNTIGRKRSAVRLKR